MNSDRASESVSSACSGDAAAIRERLNMYEWLLRVARKSKSMSAARKREFVDDAAMEVAGAGAKDRIHEDTPAVDGLNPLASYAVGYLAGLLEEAVDGSVVSQADADTRFVGYDRKIMKIRWLLSSRYLDSGLPVLFIGERGTGKGQLMRAVAAGQNARKLLEVSLAALPEGLAESELFGHEKGSFTGAVKKRDGIILTASRQRALLFLDDVAECAPAVQAKLLTCLDDGVFHPVGSDSMVSIGRGSDRRFGLFSSSQPTALRKLRPDLRDRLDVLPVWIPPLRDRGLDILLLADLAATIAPGAHSPERFSLSRGARAVLLGYRWPGNVRQLLNVVLRAAVRAGGDGVLGAELVHDCLRDEERMREPIGTTREESVASEPEPEHLEYFPTLAEAKDLHIDRALAMTGGNITRAAKLLGVHRTTLYKRSQ